MVYLSDDDLREIGTDWWSITDMIYETAAVMARKEYAQPIKPYLRFGDPANRIIAMPAYAGGDISTAGIKWIASFPGNLQRGIPRAHSVTILNEVTTGRPFCILHSAELSHIRAAAVSGTVVREYMKSRPGLSRFDIGILGFGPVGRRHLDMISGLLGEKMGQVRIYDPKVSGREMMDERFRDAVQFSGGWPELLACSDILITCTTSKKGYIEGVPKSGSLHLNVSLRDYCEGFRQHVTRFIVDDWDEVCREGTDVERMSRTMGLTREMTFALAEVLCGGGFGPLSKEDVVMFNPMGLAVFDIALGCYYYRQCKKRNTGVVLDAWRPDIV